MCGVHRATHFTIAAWLFVFIATFLTSDFQTFAADFSVVTHLFSSTEEEPVGENTTIFREGNVYDLPAFGDQITFFDNENKQFILLDTARKTWTRVSSEYLIQYGTWLKEKASNSDDPLLRFCVAPQFEVRSEKEGTLWYFEHPLLTYRVDATPFDDPEVARQYREFSDWYARLNAMLRPQALPPFPRLIVNQQLAQKDLIPRSVGLRISPSSRTGKEPLVIRSVHRVRSGLSSQDRQRLAWIESCRRKYPEVNLIAYQQRESPEKK